MPARPLRSLLADCHGYQRTAIIMCLPQSGDRAQPIK